MASTALRIFNYDEHYFRVCQLTVHGACLVCARYHSLFRLFHSELAQASDTSNLERMTIYVVFAAEVPGNETPTYSDRDIYNLNNWIDYLI